MSEDPPSDEGDGESEEDPAEAVFGDGPGAGEDAVADEEDSDTADGPVEEGIDDEEDGALGATFGAGGAGDEDGVDDAGDEDGVDEAGDEDGVDEAGGEEGVDDASGEEGVDDAGGEDADGEGGVDGEEDADDEGGPPADDAVAVGSTPGGVPATAIDPVGWIRKFRRRLATSRTLQVVVAVTVLALLARLALLGQRAAHWDEGRVAYWVLRYQQTGVWEYRPIVHGPFFFHVDKYLFTIFGPSDFVARLPVAVVGGLLPAVGWLLRDHLRDTEVVALAGLLALNPLLFYYSRFMRNDVLVAGFVLFALGLFARAYATRRPAYLYAGTLSFALAFTTKENAVLYVACWLGALGLLLDHRLIGAVRRGAITGDVVRTRLAEADSLRLGALAVVVAVNPVVVAVVPMVVPEAPVWALVGGGGLLLAGAAAVIAMDATPYHYLGTAAFLLAAPLGAYLGGETALLVFALAWVLVGALVLDAALFSGGLQWGPGDDSRRAVADGGTAGSTAASPGWVGQVPPMLVAYLLLFGTLIFFFAPRGGAVDGLGLWQSLLNPTQIPAVITEALLGSWQKLYAVWIDAPSELERYPNRVENLLRTLKTTAGLITVFAAAGLVLDRWGPDGPRDLVALAGYWGAVSVLGYPFATDIWAPWVAVHVIVPLAIPAAVAVGLLVRWGIESAQEDRPFETAVVAALLVVLALPAGITLVDVGYVGSDTHERVLAEDDERNQYVMQWAQPGNDMKRSLATAGAIARANDDGPDVLFYGTNNPVSGEMLFHVKDDDRCAARPPIHEPVDQCRGSNWHSRLPLPWYMEMYDADTTSTPPGEGIDQIREDPPPVIIAYAWNRTEIDRELPGRYERNEHRFKLWEENIVIFVDTSAIPDSGG